MKTQGRSPIRFLAGAALAALALPPQMVTQWTQDGLKRMRDIVQRAKIQAE